MWDDTARAEQRPATTQTVHGCNCSLPHGPHPISHIPYTGAIAVSITGRTAIHPWECQRVPNSYLLYIVRESTTRLPRDATRRVTLKARRVASAATARASLMRPPPPTAHSRLGQQQLHRCINIHLALGQGGLRLNSQAAG